MKLPGAGGVPLRVAVGLFVAIACAAILGMFGWQTWYAWNSQYVEWERETTNLAESLSQQAQSAFETADAAILGLRFWTERGATRTALQADVDMRLRSMPQVHSLSIFGANGDRVVGPASTRSAAVNSGSREYFRYHASHRSRAVHVGPPIVSKTDGLWVITVSRRVDKPDGSFGGLVVATIALQRFAAIYDRVDVGPNGVINLVLDSGMIATRKPFDVRYIGRDISRGAIFAHLKSSASGEFVGASILDGITRVTAYQHLSGFPLTTSVSLPIDEIFATWRSATIVGLASVLVLIGGILFVARFVLMEIGNREVAQRQLADVAFLDGLTGLANRRHFGAALNDEWFRALRDRTPLSLLMLDADFFKSYNDGYGHVMGDEVLKAIADSIRAGACRPGDVASRYGGEEFAVLLSATPLEGAGLVAERIRMTLRNLGIPHAGNPAGVVTVSIGVATIVPGPRRAIADLVTAADAALYAAKRGGRDRVELAREGSPHAAAGQSG